MMKNPAPQHSLRITFMIAIMAAVTSAATSSSSDSTQRPFLPQGKHALMPNTRIRIGPKQTGFLPKWRNRDRSAFLWN